MRKMIMSFGFRPTYIGSPEMVLKIADLIEEHLTRVDTTWHDGELKYYEVKEDGLNLEVANNPTIMTEEWYEKLSAQRIRELEEKDKISE